MDARNSNLTDPKARLYSGVGRWLGVLLSAMVMVVPTATAASTPARSADSFVGSIGINTHFYYSDTPYVEDFSLIKQRLQELGVRHVRENIAPDNRPDQYRRLRELGAAGIKADLILGDPRNSISTLDHMLSIVKTELPGALDAVEGPNEFNAQGVPDWATKLREYQQHLYTAVKSDPSLSSLTVIGPSITSWRQAAELGDISGMLDVGSVHPYTSKAPETTVSEALERSEQNAGKKPAFTTETGYHTAINSTASEPFMPVSEAAQAVYMPRTFLEYFRRGFLRTYSYELLDEFQDPQLTDEESNFGLLRNDLSKKPAFEAVQNLIGILKDPGAGFTPGSLDYSLEGSEEKLQQMLLQKRDGSYYLALWRASQVWDPARRTAIAAPTAPVTIKVSRALMSAERFEPNVSSSAVANFASPNAPLTVTVGPKVVIVKLTPGSEPVPAPAPEPEPAPDAAPAPESAPAPQPETEPAPQTAPAPAPEQQRGRHKKHRSAQRTRSRARSSSLRHAKSWRERRSLRARVAALG